MGTKGDKMTNASVEAAEMLQLSLAGLGNISTRKMFGGSGVFVDDSMFALVDSQGAVFFKADDSNAQTFAGGRLQPTRPNALLQRAG